jgi:hypothetical protein
MEKAKRKNNLEIAQKQLTRILFMLLGLSIVIFFFPLVWLDSPISPPLRTYVLVPLLSILVFIFYGFRAGLRKRDFVLLGFCLVVAILLYLKLEPCPPPGCGGNSYYGDGKIVIHMGCSSVFIYCLF